MAKNNKGIPVLNAPFSLEQEEAMKRIQLAQMNANKLPTDMSNSVQNMPMQNTQTQAPVQNVQNKPFSNTQMQQMIADYNAKQPQQQSISMPTGNETVINDNNYRDLLSRADAIKRQQNQASQTREGAYAVNHPFLSTAMSFTGAPIVGVEGLVNNALGLATGNVGNSRALEKTRNIREGAKANLGSAVTQGAYDVGTGIGDMLVNTTVANALGGGTALTGTLMGGNRANQVQRDAIDRGIGTRQASAFGTVAGAAEGYFNTKGLDAIKSGLTGNLLQKAIKGGAIEGAENILQTATEDIADALINRSDSEINTIKDNYIAQGMSETDANKQTVIDVLKQYGMDYATGFGFGTVMGAGRDALGELPRLLRNTDNTRVDADSDRVVADAIAKQNEAVDNINRLDKQLPEQARSYRDLLSDNPYYDSDDFKAFSQERNSIIETRNKITDEIRDIDKQLDNYLEPNGLDKNTARALNLYSEEAQPLLARREALQQESNSLNDRFKELSDSLDNLRDNARANELANYSFDNNFRPLSQTEYEGFDIKKGTNGEVQAALDSGKATLVEMTPEEYLRRVTYDIFNTSTMDSAIRGVENPDNIAKYAEAMRNGEKFPILNLTYDSKYGRGQEGRTRALAAYEAGIDKIPVAILGEPSENLNNRSLLDRINNARTQKDEMDIEDLIDDIEFEDILSDIEDYNLKDSNSRQSLDDYKATAIEKLDNGETPTDTVEVELLNNPDVTQNHTPEELKVMEDYLNSTDTKLVDFVNKVREDDYKTKASYRLSDADVKMADAIRDILGFETEGYKVKLENIGLKHIDNDHGFNNVSDMSMYDANTLGRIDYVLKNFDGYEKGKKRTGMYKHLLPNGKNGKADTIEFYKKVDGTYYVVEAVPMTKDKAVYIVSAYTDKSSIKNRDKYLTDVQAPVGTSETMSIPSLEKNIADANSSVNTNSAYDDADWDRLLNGANEQPDLRLLDKPNNVAENTGTNTPTTTVPMPEQEAVRTGRGNRNILGEELQPAYPKTEAEMKAETIQRAKDENSYVPLKDDIRAIATENNFKPNSEADAKAYNDFMAQAEKYIDDMENAKSDKDFVDAVGGLDALVRDAEGKIKGTTTYTESTGIEEARKQFADALIGHKVYLTQDVRDSKIPMREYNQAAYNVFGRSADGLKFVAKPTEGAVAFDQWLLENDNIKAIVGINADDGLGESLEKITNYLKSLKGKKNQTITEDYDIAKAIYDSDIWDKVSDITSKRNVAPELANKGYSKTFTNTGTRNDLVNMADEVYKRASMYDKSSNKESLDIAVKRVSEDAEGWEQRLLSGKENITDETSVDTIMLLAKDLKTQEAQARAEGNEIVARQLESRRIALMSKLREIGSKAGQKVQAFAKWNGTPEGLVLNAERLFDDNADNWGKTNKGKSDKIDKQSNFIANWWKTNFVEKAEGIVGFNEGADDDTLRQQIGDLLSSMGGDKIDPANYEGTIDTFADMVREGMSGEQLAKRIKFYLANGITDISSETVRQVEDIFNEASQLPINSKQRVELEQEAIKLLAYSKKTNATFAQKFDDWRFLAMLSKPSTHIRNMIGNTMFREVTNASDNIAAAMESVAQKAGLLENRTKAILGVKDRGLVKASTTDADTNAARTLMGSKYSENVKGDIKRAQRVYNDDLIGRGLQKASDFNSNLLEMEDYKAMRKKYSTALASYLKANGLNESVFNLEKEFNNNTRLLSNQEKAAVDTLAKAREYAIAQAEYSAFHEDNAVADILSQFSKQLNNSDSKGARILGKMFEGLLPFKKTPANIVKSAFEYAPTHAIKDAFLAVKVAKGDATLNELFDSMSKTITGTGIAALGAYLLDKGILISHDNETSNQDTLEGKQNYSIRLGDKTFTIDFLAPAVVPLLLGAEIKKVWDKNGNPNDSFWEHFRNTTSDVDSTINSAFQMASPILETTMLGGLNDTLQSISSAAKNSENSGAELFSAGMNAATSYAQQGIPSSLGAITRTIDPIRRSTTTTATGEVTQTLDKQWQKFQNKIPGLSRTNEPFIDSRGRTQNNSPTNNPLANLAYQLASPSYVSNINETEADKIEREVYGATGNPDVFSKPEYSRKVGDSKLSPADFARYKAVKGQEKTKLEEAIGQSDFFKGLSPEDQREALKTIDGLATKLGERHVRPDETTMSTTNEKLVNAYEKDGAEGVIKVLSDNKIEKTLKDQAKEIDGKATNANLLAVLEKDTTKSDYDKGYALALAMSNPGKDAEKLIEKGDYEGLYKKFSTENKYGVDLDNKKVSNIANTKGDAGLEILSEVKAKAKDKNGNVTVTNAIPVLNSMGLSDSDKGYYLTNSSSYKLAKKAQAFADSGQYDKVWTYYQLKNVVDTNNNGRTDKKERAAAIPVLQRRGYSEAEAKQIVDWYK